MHRNHPATLLNRLWLSMLYPSIFPLLLSIFSPANYKSNFYARSYLMAFGLKWRLLPNSQLLDV